MFSLFFVHHTGAWPTILRMESEAYPLSAHFCFFVFFFCFIKNAMATKWRRKCEQFCISFVEVSYFVRQGNPNGKQNVNAGHFHPEVVFCSPLRGHGTWNTNDFQTIHFSKVFCSPYTYRCPGDHFTNGIRSLSTFSTLSFFCSFLVRIKSAMAPAIWVKKYSPPMIVFGAWILSACFYYFVVGAYAYV